VPGAGL